MNLLEHESKSLLAAAKIPTPKGSLVTRKTELAPFLPLVLKSQVPTGGRGKAGGIKIVKSEDEFHQTAQDLFHLSIKGHTPHTLLAEELLAINKEFYLSLLIDRSARQVQLVAHRDGGVEVEDNTDFWRRPISEKSDAEALGQELADYFDLPEKTFILQDIIENLYTAFTIEDALLIEINPLILTDDGRLIAGDAKIILDDAAAFRHDWQYEQEQAESNFVTINPDGNVATIANGAGLAMATVDAAYDAGLIPANFLDIGGGASVETLLAAFHRIVEYPELKAIIINIFAGITKADEVAKAIITANEQIPQLPPLCIRIAGTNQEAAQELLNEQSIALHATLASCLTEAKEMING